MIAYARRACAILYNILRSRADDRPFLIPANICPVVPLVFLEAGQPFALVDIEEPSLEIDHRECRQLLQDQPDKYGGLLFVRPYGSEREPTRFFTELKTIQPGLFVIDDKCLCRPDLDGEKTSIAADVTLYSTGHAKHTDLDMGGFAHLSDSVAYGVEQRDFSVDALAEVERRCKDVAAEGFDISEGHGAWLDLRQPEIPWNDYRALVTTETRKSDEQKALLNEIYTTGLPHDVQLSPDLQTWRFNIRTHSAGKLIQSVFEAGLFASRHYAALGAALGRGSFPAAERLHSEIVNLFNDRYFSPDRAHRMVRLVLQHLEQQSTKPGLDPFP